MKTSKILVALALSACLLIPMGFAKDVWEMAQSDAYKEKTGGMLGRGFINALTSPVDIFVQTVDKTKTGAPLIGTLTGMAGGLGCTALRASSGIVDVALFWVPGFNGFPVSRSYNNCIEESSEMTRPVETSAIYQPVSQAPVISEPAAQEPLVTVVEPQPTPVKKQAAKKHDPYDYVKK